jgi:hypothetical protein
MEPSAVSRVGLLWGHTSGASLHSKVKVMKRVIICAVILLVANTALGQLPSNVFERVPTGGR